MTTFKVGYLVGSLATEVLSSTAADQACDPAPTIRLNTAIAPILRNALMSQPLSLSRDVRAERRDSTPAPEAIFLGKIRRC